MKSIFIYSIYFFLISSSSLFSQLSGNKYIPGDYTSIGEAVDSLNLYGVGNGGVTFNIEAGHIELDVIAPINATGTASSPIVFQKDGVGDNPKINFPTQTTNVAFQLMGSDYVTFDGITFENLYMGVAFLQQGANNGCLYNEIKNCEFINTTFMVWSTRNTMAVDIEGTHSFNKINNNEYYNTGISTGSTAIYFFSVDNNQSISDQGNEIGVDGGNIFSYLNSGGLTHVANINHQKSLSFENNLITCDNHNGAFYGVSSFGITFPPFLDYIASDKVSIQNNVFNLNNITNANLVTPISIACAQSLYDSILVIGNTITGTNINSASFRGIRVTDVSSEYFIVAENNIENLTTTTGIGNFTAIDFIFGSGSNYLIRNNTINNIQDSGNSLFSGIKIGLGGGNFDILENEILMIGKSNFGVGDLQGVVLHSGEVTLTNNNIQNFNHQGAGNIYGIKGSDSLVSESIQNNQIYDLIGSNGNIIGISNEGYAENSIVSNNQVFNFSASESVAGFSFDNPNPLGIRSIFENEVYNLVSDSSGFALRVGGGENVVNDNHFYAIEVTESTSTGDLSGILFHKGEISLTNNNMHSFNHQGTGNLFGIQGTDTTTLEIIENNQIYDLIISNGNVYGINSKSISNDRTIRTNEIYNLSAYDNAVGAVFENSNTHFNRNKIHNLESESINGKSTGVKFVFADSVFLSNNLIGNLTAPNSNDLNGVNGIMIDTVNFARMYYNSIVLSAENSASNFGSSAIFIGDISRDIELRNNIFINKSEANGSGMTVALRKGDDDLNILSPSNNNNLYFVDTLISNAATYHDGTNTDAPLSAFKQRMDIREQQSVTEDVVFESLNGASIDFLRPSNAVEPLIESNGQEILGYEDDYHFLSIRTNYPQAGQVNGGGKQPDIGAVEGDYMSKLSSINEQVVENIKVTLYPNPTVDEFTILFFNAKDVEHEITITDGQGNIVLNRTYATSYIKVDTREYASGVYFVCVKFGNSEIVERLIVL
ncbi:MAG: T9SS type A sorting domain-containing protein [Crocinitomicaceae bacterium]|nr:T9SS type A sorting domain-containing protein [Crocinitomicaceae bacterium]